MVNARLPDNVRGPLGTHSLALTYYFVYMFSFLCLIDTFHKQVKQALVAGTSLGSTSQWKKRLEAAQD